MWRRSAAEAAQPVAGSWSVQSTLTVPSPSSTTGTRKEERRRIRLNAASWSELDPEPANGLSQRINEMFLGFTRMGLMESSSKMPNRSPFAARDKPLGAVQGATAETVKNNAISKAEKHS